MDDVEIIQADLQNVEHQQAIMRVLNTYAQDPVILGKPLAAEVQRNLIPGLQQHPTTIVLLAYRGSKAVGIAVCFQGFSTFAAKPLINIHDLGVLPEYQGQGIGRRLLEAIEQLARRLGCCRITLEVEEANPAAKRMYLAAGFYSGDIGSAEQQTYFMKKTLAPS